MTEHEILNHIKSSGGTIPYLELLEIGRTGDVQDTLKNKDLIRQLISEGILSGKAGAYGHIRFGKQGRIRLEHLDQLQKQAEEDAKQKEAEKKAQRRHEWMLAIFAALMGALFSEPLWTLLGWIFK